MGAKIGWIVSLCLVVVVTAVALFFMLSRSSMGSPTSATTDPGKLDEIRADLNVRSLATLPDDGSGAESIYAAAVTEALAGRDPRDFTDLVKRTSEPEKNSRLMSIITKLQEAAQKDIDPK